MVFTVIEFYFPLRRNNGHSDPGMMKVAGCMQKSTAVMQIMSSLVRVPEIQATMAELSKEMMKVS